MGAKSNNSSNTGIQSTDSLSELRNFYETTGYNLNTSDTTTPNLISSNDTPYNPQTQSTQKSTFSLGNISDLISTLGNTASNVINASANLNLAKKGINFSNYPTDSQQGTGSGNNSFDNSGSSQQSKNNTFLYIIIGVIVLIVLFILLRKK